MLLLFLFSPLHSTTSISHVSIELKNARRCEVARAAIETWSNLSATQHPPQHRWRTIVHPREYITPPCEDKYRLMKRRKKVPTWLTTGVEILHLAGAFISRAVQNTSMNEHLLLSAKDSRSHHIYADSTIDSSKTCIAINLSYTTTPGQCALVHVYEARHTLTPSRQSLLQIFTECVYCPL